MSSTQTSGEMDSEEPATLTSTLPVETTHFPDHHDSEHEATPTGIYCFNMTMNVLFMLFISHKVCYISNAAVWLQLKFLIRKLVDNKNPY